MKKLISILLVIFTLTICLASCGDNEKNDDKNNNNDDNKVVKNCTTTGIHTYEKANVPAVN